jgi:hypothetical protein
MRAPAAALPAQIGEPAVGYSPMRRLLLLAALLALLALGVALSLERGDDLRAAAPAASPTTGAETDRGLAPGNGQAALPAAKSARTGLVPQDFAAPRFEPLARTPSLEGTAGEVEVHAVLAATQEPVADARVVWWGGSGEAPRGPLQRLVDEHQSLARVEELARSNAPELVADELGRVLVPRRSSGAFAFVSAEGLWGYSYFEPDVPAPLTVELRPDFDVHVRVVDASGAPQPSARVELVEHFGGASVLERATTDAEGFAWLRHSGWTVSRFAAADSRCAVALSAALATPVARALDPRRPPSDTLVLTAPSTGALEVRIVDPRGIAAAHVREVTLTITSTGAADGEARVETPEAYEVTRRVVAGVATFERVALHSEVRASATLFGSSVVSEGRGRGPTSPTTPATLELLVGAGGKLVTGGIRSALPSLSANLDLAVSYAIGDGEARVHETAHPRTDEAGRFVAEFDPTRVDLSAARFVVELSGDSSAGALRARIEPRGAGDGSVLDLGELALDAHALFASGRVVDGDGKAVRGAEILLQVRDATGAWSPAPRFGARSADDGGFELHYEALDTSEAEFSLLAATRGASSEPARVTAGARDVELVLAPDGAIAGKVLLDASISPREVELVARVKSGSGDLATLEASCELAANGEFELRGLPTGVYDLELRARDLAGTPLAKVAALQVQRGRRTRDPRLEPLDLRETARRVELSFVDEQGREVVDVVVELDGRAAPPFSPRPGVWALYTDGQPFDAWVEGPRFPRRKLRGLTESGALVLSPGP